MRRTSFHSFAITFCLVAAFVVRVSAAQSTSAADTKQDQDQKTLRFQFQESDWQDVIPWFAEQAGFSLQPITDWPEGTFFLKDDSEYTTMEALDQLNRALRLRNPPFTLIRNRKMLILKQFDDQLPPDLMETVDPEDLTDRGFYETMKCVFNVEDLNVDEIFNEIKPLASERTNRIDVFPASKQIRVMASGGQLREINEVIETAKQRYISDNQELKMYKMKHMDPESFLIAARPMLELEPNRDVAEDGSLTITREIAGDRLYLKGTKKKLALFEKVANLIDAPVEATEDVQLAKQTFKTYQILVDPKLGFDMLQTVLEGTDARMQQDETSGAITVLGRPEDHEKVVEALAALSENGNDFEIIVIESGDATEIMLAVQSLLRQTSSEEATTGPVIMANSLLNQVLVRGTPQEVAEVRRMVSQLDANSVPVQSGPRTGTRIIQMDQNEVDDVLPMMEDLLRGAGRRNNFRIVLPEDREEMRLNRMRGIQDRLKKSNDGSSTSENGPQPDNFRGSDNRSRLLEGLQSGLAILAISNGIAPLTQTGLLTWTPQDEANSVGKTSQENGKVQKQDYVPPQQLPSIPGAPIEIKVTDYGIVLVSDDLDALDDLELMIQNQLGEDSAVELPQFYFLNHRKAENIKGFLEEYYGMADSSGGGGGGAGGLMGGMMNNMLGGGTGDLLSGLMGGGDILGGTSGAGVLEGDVRFGIDVPFNAIYVAGATGNDLDQITEIIDVLDQPEPPHDPDLLGEFRTVKVFYRPASEMVELVKEQLGDSVNAGKAEGGGAQQNQEAQQMMKMMQQLAGGGGRGASKGNDPEQDKPKVILGVDEATNSLLVTGPEFIYNRVLLIVDQLDVAEVAPEMLMMPRVGNNEMIRQTLTAMFGDQVEFSTDAEGAANGGASSNNANARPGGADPSEAAQAMQKQQEAARAAIINAMRQQAGGGGGGGRGTSGRGGGGAPSGRGGGGAPSGRGGGGRGGR